MLMKTLFVVFRLLQRNLSLLHRFSTGSSHHIKDNLSHSILSLDSWVLFRYLNLILGPFCFRVEGGHA